ncbi:MAG: hypothetical protein LUG60_07850 [Erysipelotrichaceae bacterium]|nr:hypothetical protein [Erysipelotrichaceae bacterium]
MKVQNIIADELDKKAQFDEQCKKILSDPQILAYIVKSCVKECENTSIKDLIDYFIKNPAIIGEEDISVSGAKIAYDVLARMDSSILNSQNKVGLIINIEPQNDGYPGYPLTMRAIYNNARLLSRQKNIDFEKSNFGDLKKVYSIWIMCNHAKMDDGVIATIGYDYKEVGRKYENYSKAMLEFIKKRIKKIKSDIDLSNIILLYPEKQYDENDQSINGFFSLLFTNSKTSDEKKLLFEDKYGIMMTEEINEEVFGMCNMSGFMINEGKLESARKIMKNLSLTIEQTLDALEINDYDRPYFIDQLTDYDTI